MRSILMACTLTAAVLAAAPAISASPNFSSHPAGEKRLGHDDGMDQGYEDEATDGSGEPGEDDCLPPVALRS